MNRYQLVLIPPQGFVFVEAFRGDYGAGSSYDGLAEAALENNAWLQAGQSGNAVRSDFSQR